MCNLVKISVKIFFILLSLRYYYMVNKDYQIYEEVLGDNFGLSHKNRTTKFVVISIYMDQWLNATLAMDGRSGTGPRLRGSAIPRLWLELGLGLVEIGLGLRLVGLAF